MGLLRIWYDQVFANAVLRPYRPRSYIGGLSGANPPRPH
jgi:hypothetical protein